MSPRASSDKLGKKKFLIPSGNQAPGHPTYSIVSIIIAPKQAIYI